MRIFLIAGKAGSGKNTLASIIKEHYDKHNQRTIITSFSKYLKLYAVEMLKWDKFPKEKPRKFLQDIGVKVRKELGEDFLINRLKEDIVIFEQYYDNIIISDVRLINEIDSFKDYYLRCKSIYIYTEKENNLTKKEKEHITEVELEDYNNFDYNIEYVSYEDLKSKAIKILEELK